MKSTSSLGKKEFPPLARFDLPSVQPATARADLWARGLFCTAMDFGSDNSGAPLTPRARRASEWLNFVGTSASDAEPSPWWPQLRYSRNACIRQWPSRGRSLFMGFLCWHPQPCDEW